MGLLGGVELGARVLHADLLGAQALRAGLIGAPDPRRRALALVGARARVRPILGDEVLTVVGHVFLLLQLVLFGAVLLRLGCCGSLIIRICGDQATGATLLAPGPSLRIDGRVGRHEVRARRGRLHLSGIRRDDIVTFNR